MSIPEDVQARIREEKSFRAQIKRDIESQKTGEKITLWKFLNSNLGILIITSIFVTGLGSLFTLWNQKHDAAEARRREQRKILDEYDMRLNEIKFHTSAIEQATNDVRREQLLMYVWYAAHGTQEYQPALPEFRGAHMAGLVVQLEGLGDVDTTSMAAIDAIEISTQV